MLEAISTSFKSKNEKEVIDSLIKLRDFLKKCFYFNLFLIFINFFIFIYNLLIAR